MLATGVANLPTTPGNYYLELYVPFANVIYSPDGPPYPVSEIPDFNLGRLDLVVLPEPGVSLILLAGAALCLRRGRGQRWAVR